MRKNREFLRAWAGLHADGAGMTRRELLQGLAALAASGLVPAALGQGAGALSAAEFRALSTSMTGFAYGDGEVASAMLHALASSVGGSTLSKIAVLASATPSARLGDALREAQLDAAATKVFVALYSGVVDTPSGPVVFAYDKALAWRAVPWTKPNAECGGETDYWSKAPQ